MSIQGIAAQSLLTFRNNQGVEARGTLLKLTRSTVVFEVYNPYSIVQLSEVLQNLTLRHRDNIIYHGRAVVSNLVNTGLMLLVSVTLVDPWSDLTDRLGRPGELHLEVSRFIDDWNRSYQIRPGYQLAVSNLRSFLGEFRQWLEQVDMEPNRSVENNSEDSGDKQEIFDAIAEPALPQLEELFSRFEEEADKVEEPELTVHKAYVQRDLHPLMLRSPFIHRAYMKPLGYAGDYEMVNMMLRDDREGPSTFAQLLNRYYLNIGPSIAHRNRIDILEQTLVKIAQNAAKENRRARIMNIGCGPAIEVQRFIERYPLAERCDFSLMDFNEQTLSYAKRMIHQAAVKSGNLPNFWFIEQSVHTLIKQAASKGADTEKDRYDLVYCAGLFDYLSDKVCTRLLALFCQWARIGGTVLVTNVHPSNPNRFQMEHIAEWYLIYRRSEEMDKIAPKCGERNIYRDESGVNVFMEMVK
ncbi:class I SAM-dependent methyltransferase [Endothiovibrio diazotrophicus]